MRRWAQAGPGELSSPRRAPVGPMRTSEFQRSDTQSRSYGLYSSGAADLSDLVPAAFTRVNIFFLQAEVAVDPRHRSPLVAVEDDLLLHDGRQAGAPKVRRPRGPQVHGGLLAADLENAEVRQGPQGGPRWPAS